MPACAAASPDPPYPSDVDVIKQRLAQERCDDLLVVTPDEQDDGRPKG